MTIINASTLPFAQTSQMPNMASTLYSWLIPMTIGVVVKVQNGFMIRETTVEKKFYGVWQPLDVSHLQVKEEGQRHWNWYWIHSTTDLQLSPDDIVVFEGKQYRVMGDKNFKLNGFFEYELIEDFTGAGPERENNNDP